MEELIDELKSHFCSNVLCTVQRLQSAEDKTNDMQNTPSSEGDWTMDVAGNELLQCIDGLSKVKVCETNCLICITQHKQLNNLQISTFLRTNITYDNRDAYGVVLNKVPGLDSITKKKIRDFVKVKCSPSRGLVSNPRSFLPDHLANQQQVCVQHTNIKSLLHSCIH